MRIMTDRPAHAIAFRRLPFLVQLAAMLTFYMAWVMFAEFIVDRHGLDRYLPFYRVGKFCLYDAAIVALLLLSWLNMRRERS
jgi:hypothetical protein